MFVDWDSCAATVVGVEDKVATLSCVPEILKVVVFWALVFAGIVALFLVIYSGYKFLTSGGDPKSVDSARKTLTFGIAGFILILLSFLIINVIAEITGVSSIREFNIGNSGSSTFPASEPVRNNPECISAGGVCMGGCGSNYFQINTISCGREGSCCKMKLDNYERCGYDYQCKSNKCRSAAGIKYCSP